VNCIKCVNPFFSRIRRRVAYVCINKTKWLMIVHNAIRFLQPSGSLTWQDQLNRAWAKVSNVLNPVGSSQYLLYVTPKVHGCKNQVSLHWKENILPTLIYWALQQSSELTFLLVSTIFLLNQLLQHFVLRNITYNYCPLSQWHVVKKLFNTNLKLLEKVKHTSP
jgi:hypothetical protein